MNNWKTRTVALELDSACQRADRQTDRQTNRQTEGGRDSFNEDLKHGGEEKEKEKSQLLFYIVILDSLLPFY